jgi:hypothetical protein
MSKIKVSGTEITIIKQDELDYISLTDMVRNSDGEQLIKNWLRNKNTVEFLGIWERLNNQRFNMVDFDLIRKEAGTNRFLLSVSQWVERTNAIGIMSKSGRYGGTYAHKDIAFEFGTWISPEFKLLLIKEFQRLKDQEGHAKNLEWDYRRFLSKINYRLQTDAIKDSRGDGYKLMTSDEKNFMFANEAEILNVALVGCTSQMWRKDNPEKVAAGHNLRDFLDVIQLTVMSNMESMNAELIREGLSPEQRFDKLQDMAKNQLTSMYNSPYSFSIESPHAVRFVEQAATSTDFDQTLGAMMSVPPPKKKG